MNWFGSLLKIKLLVFAGLLAGVFLLPWWLSLLLAALAALGLPRFYAVALVGLLLDIIFHPPEPFLGIVLPATILLLILVALSEPLRERLMWEK